MNILLDTKPLSSGHAHRGIGMYTRLLSEYLEKIPGLNVFRTSEQQENGRALQYDLTHYPFFDLFYPTLPFHLLSKAVITIHDLIPLKFPSHYPVGMRGRIAHERQKIALRLVSRVITDSLSSKSDILEYFSIEEEKVTVVPLAAHPLLTAATPKIINQVREKLSLPAKYILYVGDINYNKNIPQLVKAVKYLPDDVSLVCVGRNFISQSIPEWQWIETQIALSGVGERVRFITTILHESFDDLSAIYSGAIAYVQPSIYEGFGLPILEAMQCKVPVVTTPLSSLPEVGGQHCIYAQPNAEDLAEGIQSVLAWSQTKRQSVIKAAYEWSRTFSWEKTAQKTFAVYTDITT